MKKVLILGAGVYQVPLIKKAKEMGLYVIVCSIEGDYPGFQYADKVYYINTVDKEKVLSVAEKEDIQGILTTGTDVAVKTIGYVCEKMDLPGISQQCAEFVTDKTLMKDRLLKGGARTGNFRKVKTLEEAKEAFERLGRNVMFKCVDKSGSRGIIQVTSIEEIKKAYEIAMNATDKDYILIEQYIEGVEIGVDGYVKGDKWLIVPHNKKVLSNGMTNVPVGHSLPFDCQNDELLSDLELQVKSAVRALGIDNNFFNMDIIYNKHGNYIIEVGARVGATCIPELISIYYNIDFYKMMIKNALGENIVDGYCSSTPCTAELLTVKTGGIIRNIQIKNVDNDSVEDIVIDYTIGDRVRAFCNGTDRIGAVIVSGDSLEAAENNLEAVKAKIHFTIEEE